MNLDFLHNHFKLSDPLEYMKITQDFGEKNQTSFYVTHTGLDLRASIGTHCFASIDGTAYVFTDNIKDPEINRRGKGVRIYTDPMIHNGEEWRLDVLCYHLSEQLVKTGDRITRGQLIAYTGNTGRFTTAPHLHFSVRPQRKVDGVWKIYNYANLRGYVDPKLFLTYEPIMVDNPHNLADDTLVQLTEGVGGFGFWSGEKFYSDTEDKIIATYMSRALTEKVIDGDVVSVFKTQPVQMTQMAWDSYEPKFNLRGEKL